MNKSDIVRALCRATTTNKTGSYKSYYASFTGLDAGSFKTPIECLYSFLVGKVSHSENTEQLQYMWNYVCTICNIDQTTGVPNV